MTSKSRGIAAIILCAVLILSLTACGKDSKTPVSGSDLVTPNVAVSSSDLVPSVVYPASGSDLAVALPYDLGGGLYIDRIGYYTGAFVEDGSMETVYNVAGITVRNGTGKTVESAVIKLGKATFNITLLPDGESALSAETGKMSYSRTLAGEAPELESVEYLDGESVSGLETAVGSGEISVKNMTRSDIGAVTLLCGYESSGTLLSGMCVEIPVDGIAAGETKTVPVDGAQEGTFRVVLVVEGK